MSYKLKYTLNTEHGNFSKEEVMAERETNKALGATDALVIGSCLFPDDGSYSQAIYTFDGRTGEDMSGNDLWKFWFMLTAELKDRDDVSENKRALAKEVFDVVRASILGKHKHDSVN